VVVAAGVRSASGRHAVGTLSARWQTGSGKRWQTLATDPQASKQGQRLGQAREMGKPLARHKGMKKPHPLLGGACKGNWLGFNRYQARAPLAWISKSLPAAGEGNECPPSIERG